MTQMKALNVSDNVLGQQGLLALKGSMHIVGKVTWSRYQISANDIQKIKWKSCEKNDYSLVDIQPEVITGCFYLTKVAVVLTQFFLC